MSYRIKHEANEGKGKHASAGKGWGDGQKAHAFHESQRKHISERMATSEYTSFRPRIDNEGVYWIIRDWGSEDVPDAQRKAGFEGKGVSLSALFNSLLASLAKSVQDTTQIDPETGEISIEMNFGRIVIK